MNERQKKLLKSLIEEHIRTAVPVGSLRLAGKSGLQISSATVRNEMAELESAGLICQPYTSAGRVPTEKGYHYYVENFVCVKSLPLSEKTKIDNVLSSKADERTKLKELAKTLADLSGEAVVLAFDKNDVYYTGISNFFSKPELANRETVYNFFTIIDRLDEVIYDYFDTVTGEPEIVLGKKNPFGDSAASVVMRFEKAVLTLLGTMRMDYNKCLSLFTEIKKQAEYICLRDKKIKCPIPHLSREG